MTAKPYDGKYEKFTLDEAKHRLMKAFDKELASEGKAWNWLTRKVTRRYRRRVDRTQAQWLIALYRASLSNPGGWTHVNSDALPRERGGSYGHLQCWGLIERPKKGEGKRPDGSSRVGLWRITPLGRRWVTGDKPISKYAYLVEGRVIGWGGPQVQIHEVIEGFDYNELIGKS